MNSFTDKRLTTIVNVFFLVYGLFFLPVVAKAVFSDEVKRDSRRLVGIISYIQGDYPEAIKNSKIINEDEFREMLDFSSSASELLSSLAKDLDGAVSAKLKSDLKLLSNCISKYCPYSDIYALTERLQDGIILNFSIAVAPKEKPNLSLAQNIYAQSCTSCHGVAGDAKTPLAKVLDPPPRSFLDHEYMQLASPFKFYNVLQTGVEGTAMLSFKDKHSVKELWSVAFYLMGLRYSDLDLAIVEQLVKKNTLLAKLSVSFLAENTDIELHMWLKDNLKAYIELEPSYQKALLAYLRLKAPYQEERALIGREHKLVKKVSNSLWTKIEEFLSEARVAFDNGEFARAKALLLDAYLIGFEKVEVVLKVSHPSLAVKIEQLFLKLRSYAHNQDNDNFKTELDNLYLSLNEAKLKLSKTNQNSHFFINGEFLSSALIILREGFEAFLIVLALLLIVKNLGAYRAARWIHAGWIFAVLLGFVAYYLFEKVLALSGESKELVEAVFTGLAVVVLFYTGFWLLNQFEQKNWSHFIKSKAKSSLNKKNMFGLAFMSFLAVFRESAETVLFYSVLFQQAESAANVSLGFVVGLIILFLMCLVILKYNVRIPMQSFFRGTSLLMMGLSVVLCGKTINELIEAGYVQADTLKMFPTISFLGVYPTVQTIASQVFMLLLTFFIFFFYKKKAS